MIPVTNEPMEGVVFDVQDHTRQIGTSEPVHMGIWLARTSMGLKSPSDGCWDGRDRATLWWAIAQEGRRTFHPGHFCRARPRGNRPLQMERLTLMDRTSPEIAGHWLERVAVWWGYWHVWQLGGALEGLTSDSWMLDMPKKGQRLPQKGLTSPFSSYYDNF